MCKFHLFIFLIFFCLFSFSSASALDFTGKVVGILDGDTINLLSSDNTQLKIRMAQIDAPEKNQPYGQTSKKVLSDLVYGKVVTVQAETVDRYGRTVGRIFLSKKDINLSMVRLGAAWAYRQYITDEIFLHAEQAAQTDKLGLWSLQLDQAVPPWEWRKGIKSIKKDNKSTASSNPLCGSKTRCREMVSCVEATKYLNECNVTTLDGDLDGIPCEALCR